MRIDPSKEYSVETKEEMQKKVDAVTRKVAIAFVITILVFFYYKMLAP